MCDRALEPDRNSLRSRGPPTRPSLEGFPGWFMADELLSAAAAAEQLGIKVTTFYDWLGRSRLGELEIRGQRVTIDYLQGGAKGQGRIRIEAQEIARLKELMRVGTRAIAIPRSCPSPRNWPGIVVPLGRPK